MGHHRARIEHRGRAYHLGYYDTKFEVSLAKRVAAKLLRHLERTKPEARPPALEVIARLANMGTFDGDVEVMRLAALTLASRYNMVTGMKHRPGPAWGTYEVEVPEGIHDITS
jgi:hypothetical protein|tara:strand:- start:1176 stop:1514 length:339 start_codon:yes stop_codon:yes gene_type:complete